MGNRDAITEFLDRTLRTGEIKDVSCNGLQVQGAGEIQRVALAVDACLEAYEKAVAADCQMLIVHHGLIWNGLTHITGRIYEHVRFLLEHDLNLYASHLPLDMNENYGNNIELARMLKLQEIGPFGSYHGNIIGFKGLFKEPVSPKALAERLSSKLGGQALILQNGGEKIQSVGIVSGGAGDMLEQAAGEKLDCYLTGEPVHFCYQLARELNTNVIFLGHYHSEKPGVQALGRLLEQTYGLQTVFLELGALTAAEHPD